MDDRLINTLNYIRWISALMVIIGHLRSFLFVSFSQVEQKTYIVKMFYTATGFGHQAVIIFFVLSGYLVGGGVINKYKLRLTDYTDYFIKRFARVYTVLIPALIIGLILDNFGYILFPELYTNKYQISAMNFDAYKNLNFQVLLGNIFNTQTILVDPLGTNGPLWSLSNEWSYYVLFVFLFINNLTRVLFLLLISIIGFYNISILIFGFVWIIGALFVLIDRQILHRYVSTVALLVILAISRKYHGYYIDFSIGLSIVLVINSLRYSNPVKASGPILLKDFNKKMADFSYSSYLFHFPFLVFTISVLNFNSVNILQMQPNIDNIAIYLIVLILIYLFSFGMYMLFERHTYKLYSAIRNIGLKPKKGE
jgi:peptidoglycan/LPS O-acetylase OafA/YrhL